MKTIEEINRQTREGGVSPLVLIEDFLDHVRRGTFDELFAQLDPKLQKHVVELAKLNVHSFDETIEALRERGFPHRVEPWLAYKEWAERQPWVEEARAIPKPVPWTEEQMDAFLAAEYAEALADMGRFMQKRAEDAGKPDAAEWRPVVEKLEETSKQMADRAEAILPKKR